MHNPDAFGRHEWKGDNAHIWRLHVELGKRTKKCHILNSIQNAVQCTTLMGLGNMDSLWTPPAAANRAWKRCKQTSRKQATASTGYAA
eukprot:1158599-Pelagomonas_calceolata.AAC.6